jgi:taurine dioxygenase
MALESMALESRPLDGSVACEIVGLRLWQPLDDRIVEQIHELWAHHPVLVFRRQALSEPELAAFSARFGPLERVVRTEWASPVVPEVGVMLYAVELPPAGGATFWVDLAAAYAALPDRLKHLVEGKLAVFDYVKRLAGYQGADRVISEEAKRKTPPVLHPLVHSHPMTGSKALYLDSTTTVGIEGTDEASASALLNEIYTFATQPEFVYRHDWQIGDVVMWDNGFTMHRREPFDPAARRLMKRTTIFLSRERHIVPAGRLATEEALL